MLGNLKLRAFLPQPTSGRRNISQFRDVRWPEALPRWWKRGWNWK